MLVRVAHVVHAVGQIEQIALQVAEESHLLALVHLYVSLLGDLYLHFSLLVVGEVDGVSLGEFHPFTTQIESQSLRMQAVGCQYHRQQTQQIRHLFHLTNTLNETSPAFTMMVPDCPRRLTDARPLWSALVCAVILPSVVAVVTVVPAFSPATCSVPSWNENEGLSVVEVISYRPVSSSRPNVPI